MPGKLALIEPTFPLATRGTIVNAKSWFQRPNDTTAYAQNDYIGPTTVVATIPQLMPYFVAARVPGASCIFMRYRLYTNVTTGWGTGTFFIEFWSSPPGLNAGDNGAYAITTGAFSFLGSSTTLVMTQVSDGAYVTGIPTTTQGTQFGIALDPGQDKVWWTMKEADAGGLTPIANQKFLLVAELYQN